MEGRQGRRRRRGAGSMAGKRAEGGSGERVSLWAPPNIHSRSQSWCWLHRRCGSTSRGAIRCGRDAAFAALRERAERAWGEETDGAADRAMHENVGSLVGFEGAGGISRISLGRPRSGSGS